MKVGVVDYGFCNINSVLSTCKEILNDTEIISSPEQIREYERVILPGVGNFESASKTLTKLGFFQALTAHISEEKKLLGICLGMQLLLGKSEESSSNTQGLKFIEGEVLDLSNHIIEDVPIPHMGWSEISLKKDRNPIIEGLASGDAFYFANSYFCKTGEENVVAYFEHGKNIFPAIISNNKNIYGVQFHPEKSQAKGIQVLRNFFTC